MKKAIGLFIIIIFTVQASILFGQDSPFDIWLNPETKNFLQIKQKAENYFAGKYKGQGSGYIQWKRWEYTNERRLTPNGEITNHTLQNWLAYKEYLKQHKSAETTNGAWYSLGPTSYINGAGWNPGIGRVNCITFHPTDPNIIYIGTPAGGLWKTTDDGISWSNLCNGLPSIGISGIAINPNNTDNIYILTGDGDGGNTYSFGVMVTYNGGLTWEETGFSWTAMNYIRGYKLLMHPYNPNLLFVACNYGIYRTDDAGVTWIQVISGTFYDIEFKPGNPSVMYASKSSSFWKSTDTGNSWTQITSGLPTYAERIAIGVSPANSNYVYLLCGPATSYESFQGVYVSSNSGDSFFLASNSPNILGASSTGDDNKHQSKYDLAIAVSRTNHTQILTGGINVWRSLDYGYNWEIMSYWNNPNNTIGYTHADIHALEINPLNNYIYCGSDGGIFKSTDFGLNWIDLTNGISITQWYRIAGYEPSPNLLIGGTQDNGTNKWTGDLSFTHILGADGMDCMIDYSNKNIMYYSTQNGGLHKSVDGGASAFEIKPSGATGSWVTPYIMDPVNPNILYAGYDDVYKSTDGGLSWSNLGIDGRSAMAIGTNNTEIIYATDGNLIFRSDDGGNNWSGISSGLPEVHINFIAVNPDNAFDVFITLSGFHNNLKVFASNNGGDTWTNITGSLPNIIVSCIAYEDRNGSPDDAIYIGTDVGVFYRDNNLGDWIPFSNYLPVTPVRDIEINEGFNIITAATYGRGLWRSTTYTQCINSLELNGNAPIGYSYYQASNYIQSTFVFNQGVGQEGYLKAGNFIKLLPGFNVSGGSKFKAWIGACSGGIPYANFKINTTTVVNNKTE